MYYSDHLASAGEICLVLGQYAPKYMDWFFIISHPFMIATQQSDLPRHPPAMHDASFVKPHIPQVPKPPTAAPTHPCSHVDQPRHAMVSVTVFLVVSNVIYVNYFNINLSNLFIFYLIGCLPCDH